MAIPTSFSYDRLSDYLHRLRQKVDSYTPGPSSVLNMLGMGPMGAMVQANMQGDVLNNHKVAVAPQGPAAAPAPSVPALGGLGLFPPTSPQSPNWLRDAQMTPTNAPAPAPAPAAPAPAPQAATVPMPAARPAAAPAAPDPMSWFQRNAALMTDPAGGGFIDPQAAARANAQVRGPDLIAKMMNYLHDKPTS